MLEEWLLAYTILGGCLHHPGVCMEMNGNGMTVVILMW